MGCNRGIAVRFLFCFRLLMVVHYYIVYPKCQRTYVTSENRATFRNDSVQFKLKHTRIKFLAQLSEKTQGIAIAFASSLSCKNCDIFQYLCHY